MRYFMAIVTTRDENLSPVNAEGLGELFEQLDKRALVVPGSRRGMRRAWHYDSEREEKQFPVFVFAGAARVSAEDAEHIVREACDIWHLTSVDRVDVQDATFSDDLNSESGWGQVISRSVAQRANLFEIRDMAMARRVFKDWMVTRRDATTCLANIRYTPCSQSLGAEAARMFAAHEATRADAGMVPVHYIVEGSESVKHEASVDALLETLLSCDRLPSEHAFRIDFDSIDLQGTTAFEISKNMDEIINDAFANALAGNVVVARYGRMDEDGRFNDRIYGNFCHFVEAMRPYLADTLLVFSIPSGNEDLRRRIRRLVRVPLVTIGTNAAADARTMSREQAMATLEDKAARMGWDTDGRLGEMLDERLEDASFSDLDGLLDDWHGEKVINEQYPEYKAELEETTRLFSQRESDAMARLDELVGLGEVKRQIKVILARFRMMHESARQGLPVQPFSMHLAFLGAPGTGKTEVARLYGQILKETGVLSEGRVISVSGSDVVRSDVEKLFDKARGSVLFIDEAYAMTSASITISELIAHMENRRDDTVVILAGYEGEMNRLLDSNPGFRSRIGFTLHFAEYDEDELLEIFDLMCRRADLKVEDDAHRSARDLLARNGRRPDQGNARYVRKLFEDCLGAQQARLAAELDEKGEAPSREELQTLLACDVEEAGDLRRDEVPAREELEALIGLEKVKELVSERIAFMKVQKLRRDAELPADAVPMHMAFLGAPGTGKTEVARLMGRILRDEGILSVGEFYECTGSRLLSGMPGESTLIVHKLFQKARGSVIFIDEAYSLLAPRADEAITALIAEMENYRDEVVVILAGYDREIRQLLEANPGFESRVRTKIEFDDYSADELADIFCLMARRQELEVGAKTRERAREVMVRARGADDFGNARFARNLLENALLRQGVRLAGTGGEPSADELCEILPEDVEWSEPAESRRAPMGFTA